jgi:hypothetical protein
MTDNPFFEAWKTPFDLPPFDRIRMLPISPPSPDRATRLISPIRSRRWSAAGNCSAGSAASSIT